MQRQLKAQQQRATRNGGPASQRPLQRTASPRRVSRTDPAHTRASDQQHPLEGAGADRTALCAASTTDTLLARKTVRATNKSVAAVSLLLQLDAACSTTMLHALHLSAQPGSGAVAPAAAWRTFEVQLAQTLALCAQLEAGATQAAGPTLRLEQIDPAINQLAEVVDFLEDLQSALQHPSEQSAASTRPTLPVALRRHASGVIVAARARLEAAGMLLLEAATPSVNAMCAGLAAGRSGRQTCSHAGPYLDCEPNESDMRTAWAAAYLYLNKAL